LALPESLVGVEQQRLGLGESGQTRLVAQRGIEDCYRNERATELASGFGQARASGPERIGACGQTVAKQILGFVGALGGVGLV